MGSFFIKQNLQYLIRIDKRGKKIWGKCIVSFHKDSVLWNYKFEPVKMRGHIVHFRDSLQQDLYTVTLWLLTVHLSFSIHQNASGKPFAPIHISLKCTVHMEYGYLRLQMICYSADSEVSWESAESSDFVLFESKYLLSYNYTYLDGYFR